MKEKKRPTVITMVKQAVEALGGKTTNLAVRDWILKKYPGTNKSTISCQIMACTVNHPSRIHYMGSSGPRKADGPNDILYRPATGEIVWYDPVRHGAWEIAEREDGTLVVRESGKEDDEPGKGEQEQSGFAAEAHLRDYLAKNLDIIEKGLQLFVDENGNAGVEYITEIGRIDLLAVDKKDGLLVIELKVARGPDQVCGQIMRYVGWVKRHLANGKPVRGLVIARNISDRIRYALADVPNVTAREYELHITLNAVAHIDKALK